MVLGEFLKVQEDPEKSEKSRKTPSSREYPKNSSETCLKSPDLLEIT